ncbi:hypothetical protein H6F74_21105 [Trichocoleus sp. FACHB-90]|uniref:hypothetical protein n=1 Tax=Trichocoleus sp. FACHB-90 TaxID=2692876 RepID=UPI0019B17620|nr:hypothetical protein [Trichocoleus sp. FACHB-90]MBD1928727.1 hypothetical protein [Trichocoleus sp. FACHB-90]
MTNTYSLLFYQASISVCGKDGRANSLAAECRLQVVDTFAVGISLLCMRIRTNGWQSEYFPLPSGAIYLS